MNVIPLIETIAKAHELQFPGNVQAINSAGAWASASSDDLTAQTTGSVSN
jgi:hypothetical protein